MRFILMQQGCRRRRDSKKLAKLRSSSDDQKRQTYDNLGHQGFDQRYSSEDISVSDFDSIFRDMGFGDIFRSFLAGRLPSFENATRSDLAYNLEIILKSRQRN